MSIHIESDSVSQAAAPLVSVVIPTLVADLELRRCVDSVRLVCPQAATCEVVIVAPPGQVQAILALLPGETVIAERRPSIYGAMNDGVAASHGEYLYFLGKDDIVLPSFARMLQVLGTERPGAIFGDVYWGASGIYPGRPSRWRVLVRNFCHQGIVYSRDAFRRHGPYNRKMRVQADHLLNIRLLWDRGRSGRILYFPQPLAWYSGAGFSIHQARDPVFWKLYPTIMKRFVGGWARLLLVSTRKLRGR